MKHITPVRPQIIGESSQIKEVHAVIERFAGLPISLPVMIYGETGTGKELFAQLLHFLSERKNGPFVAVNAGAIPEALVESELFGYVGGAFTSALREGKVGLWEAANGGTLFLDEIGNLPLAYQPKVLRVLQERVIRRVGGTENISVDTRIIAATNINLSEGVKEKTFRQDLYYRLHVLHVTIPPLRERHGDILLILDYLIRKLCAEWKLGDLPIVSEAAKNKLLGYSWPGNIRELENVVMRTLSLYKGTGELHADDFKLYESEVGTPLDMFPDLLSILVEKGTFRHMRMQAEFAIMRWALGISQENQGSAAQVLGIHRNTLIEKIRKHHLYLH
jgi:transcriptional regulator with PAS, ATPase and Fis domain